MSQTAAVNGNKDEVLGPKPNNDAAEPISFEEPYTAVLKIEGVCPMLFHRWSNEAVKAKAEAKKNSKEKKTDNVESYLYRGEGRVICLPGAYLKGAISGPQGAAKFRQDPRSTRKSALDLYKAGVQVLTELAPLGTHKAATVTEWDFLDERRVMVQRQGITRARPAFMTGWRAEFELLVQTPEYISPSDLLEVIGQAGRLVGVGDFRPTYGRFQVIAFEVLGA